MNIGIELLCSRLCSLWNRDVVHICMDLYMYARLRGHVSVTGSRLRWSAVISVIGFIALPTVRELSSCTRDLPPPPPPSLLLFFSLFFLDIWLHVCVNVHTNLPTDINRQAVLQPYNEIGTYSPPSSGEMSMGFSRRV